MVYKCGRRNLSYKWIKGIVKRHTGFVWSGIPHGGVHQWSSVCDVNSMKIKINRHALYVDRSKRFWLVLKKF